MIAEIAAAVLTVLAGLVGLIAWFYRRGRQEQALASSVDRNTEATNNLAAQVGGLRDTLESHSQVLTEHHFRLKALEEREVRVTVK